MIDRLLTDRIKKIENFRKQGLNPYPAKTKRTHIISEALNNFLVLEKQNKKISIVGRIIGLRLMGGVIFADLQDWSGKIQLVIKKNNVKNFQLFADNLDVGDFLNGEGLLFTTRKGEKSIDVKYLELIAKNIRPLPDKWHGLEDTETKLRQRYLDILLNPEVKNIFLKKIFFGKVFANFLIEKILLK